MGIRNGRYKVKHEARTYQEKQQLDRMKKQPDRRPVSALCTANEKAIDQMNELVAQAMGGDTEAMERLARIWSLIDEVK